MELELAPALFIQPYGSGIIAPGKPTQQNATATKSINVLPVDVSAGVHSGHHPPPSPASRMRAGMTGAQPPAHTQPKNPEREIRGGQVCGFNVSALPAQAADANRAHDRGRAESLAAVSVGRQGAGSAPRAKQLLGDLLDPAGAQISATTADPDPGRSSCSGDLLDPAGAQISATAVDPDPGRSSCSGDLLDPAGAQISATAADPRPGRSSCPGHSSGNQSRP